MSNIYTYSGTLETYHEQGMGSTAVILHDDRGLYKAPGFNNETRKWDGPLEDFKSLEWAVWFGIYNDITYDIEIFNDKNKIVYKGPLTFRSHRGQHHIPVPLEIPIKKWSTYVFNKYRAVLKTNDFIKGLKELKHKEFNNELKKVVHEEN